MPEQHTPFTSQRSQLGLAVGLFMACFVVTRLVDLGRQSLWNDEVFNRDYADVVGQATLPGHPVTYWGIRIASMLTGGGDAAWVVRLPSAVAMLAAGLGLFLWAWHRLGRGVAVAFGALFLVNPMAITYAQDGNHYAWLFLGGAAATVAAGEFWLGRTWGARRAGIVTLLVVLILVLYGAHPFEIVAAVAMALTGVLAMVHGAAQRSANARRPWAIAAVVAAVVGGAAWYVVSAKVATFDFAGAPHAPKSVLEGWIPFRVPTSFFGAFLQESVLDYLTAFVVSLAAGWGAWIGLRAGGPLRGVALVTVLMLVMPLGFFTVYPGFLVLFQVRYLIFALGPLLLLWAVLLAQAVAVLKATGPRHAFVVLGGATVLLYGLRVLPWAAIYYTGQYQPLVPAMEAIADKLPPNAIIGSRPIFLTQAFDSVGERRPALQRDYRWLGDAQPSSRNAASQALFLAARNPGRVYTLELEWKDEEMNVDYHQFSRSACEEVAFYPSFVARDFQGVGRSLVLRRVPDIAAFGTLPMPGADAIRAFSPGSVLYAPQRRLDETGTPMFGLRAGAGASWFLRPAESDVAVDLQLMERRAEDRWVTARVAETQAPLAWRIPAKAPDRVQLRVPAAALSSAAEGSTLHLWFPRVVPAPAEGEPNTWIQIHQLRPAEGSSNLLSPTELAPIATDIVRQEGTAGADGWIKKTPGWNERVTLMKAEPHYRLWHDSDSSSLEGVFDSTPMPDFPPGAVVIAIMPIEVDNLALHQVRPRLHWMKDKRTFGTDLVRGRLPATTLGPIWPSIVFEDHSVEKVEPHLIVTPNWSQGPIHGSVSYQAPQLFVPAR